MNRTLRLVGFIIAIIIPILAAAFIANYSYNWRVYRDEFREEYLHKENTSEKSLDRYIEFDSYLFEKEPFINYAYTDEEGNVLFNFKVFRTLSLDGDEPTIVSYKFFIYNIDYEKLIHLTHDNVKPGTERQVYFKMTVAAEEEEPRTIRFQDSILNDLDAEPKFNSKGEKTFYKIKQITLTLNPEDFPTSGQIILYEGELKYDRETGELNPEDSENYTEFARIDFSDFTFEAADLDTDDFVEGLHRDILKAGYGKHIFKTKMWWQVILTLLVTGIITFSFFFVWDYEQRENNQSKRGK